MRPLDNLGPTSWTTWGLAGMWGAPLSCERLDAPAYVSIRPGADQLWRTQEGAHGDGQTEAWPQGQRCISRCIMPGQDVLDRLGLLLYRRELLGEALDGVAEQPSLGDGGVEKACLVDVLHLCQVEPEMALLDHHGGHRLPEGHRLPFPEGSQSPCAAPASTLAVSLQALDGRRGRFLQVAAFRGHKCTATALSTWGMPAYPLATPPSRVVRTEEADERLLAVSRAPLRETNRPAARARDWAVC